MTPDQLPDPPAPLQRAVYPGLPPQAVAAIAALFNAEPARAQFSQAIDPVYEISHRGPNGNLRLALWPSLARVDATVGPHAWIARPISETEIIPNLEVIFRFGTHGLLTIALTGQALMVADDAER